jgi:hypothetical protein
MAQRIKIKYIYTKFSNLLILLLITIGVILFMANKINNREWDEYISRPSRTLRIELAAPYDQIVSASGLDSFVKMTYKSNDNNESFSMSPWQEPSKSPVIVSYGFPDPIFELPPSTFVSVIFKAAHVVRLTVNPMLKPLYRAETIELARSLIELLDVTPLVKIPEDNITVEEVWLQMQLLAKDMDNKSFEIGLWKLVKPSGTVGFSLSIEVISDHSMVDPSEQLYSTSLFIYSLDHSLAGKLKDIRLAARTKVMLTKKGKPCPIDSLSCDIPDVRVYLDTLRKEKLIPLK